MFFFFFKATPVNLFQRLTTANLRQTAVTSRGDVKVCFDIRTFTLTLPQGAAVTSQANYES